MALDPKLYADRLARENTMWETQNRALGGSRTADNLADQGAMDGMSGEVMRAGKAAANLQFGDMVQRVAGALAPLVKGQNEPTRALIAQMLLSGNAGALVPVIAQAGKSASMRRLLEAIIRQPMRESRKALLQWHDADHCDQRRNDRLREIKLIVGRYRSENLLRFIAAMKKKRRRVPGITAETISQSRRYIHPAKIPKTVLVKERPWPGPELFPPGSWQRWSAAGHRQNVEPEKQSFNNYLRAMTDSRGQLDWSSIVTAGVEHTITPATRHHCLCRQPGFSFRVETGTTPGRRR